MRKYSLAVLVIASMALLALASPSARTQEAKDPQGSQKMSKVQSGEVVSVDAAKNDLVIKDASGAETHLTIAPSTKITKGGKSISLADVKAGDTVTCECEDSSGGCKAKSVTVSPGKTE
ncbi:MAG TPA: hypothetical protein VKM94_22575 [Blastocatellia bacterium]|nr:hypothetical protein [Blastocatellia bacterium]